MRRWILVIRVSLLSVMSSAVLGSKPHAFTVNTMAQKTSRKLESNAQFIKTYRLSGGSVDSAASASLMAPLGKSVLHGTSQFFLARRVACCRGTNNDATVEEGPLGELLAGGAVRLGGHRLRHKPYMPRCAVGFNHSRFRKERVKLRHCLASSTLALHALPKAAAE